MSEIGRRQFIAGLGGAAAVPRIAGAQQSLPVIGYIGVTSFEATREFLAVFHRSLGDAGYVVDQNVAIEYRWAEGQYDRLAALAADLVHRNVAVIVTMAGTRPALAAQAATATIPIVFEVGADPVEYRLVASLSRPGGNLTGVFILNVEVIAKRLQLLHEIVPTATTIAYLANPSNTGTVAYVRELQVVARVLGVNVLLLNASLPSDIELAFAVLVQQRAGALIVSDDPFIDSQTDKVIALAARYAIPAIYQYREFAAVGGLISYGPIRRESARIMGAYVGRILKGEKPANLPVQQATNIELTINMKTAKALGLTFPLTLLGRADEVFE